MLQSQAIGTSPTARRLGTQVPREHAANMALQAAPTPRNRAPTSSSAAEAKGHATAGITRAPMLHTCSHKHAQLRAGAGGPAAAFIRRQPRGQPLPRIEIAPSPLQQRRRGQGEPPPRASRNYSRAYAAHLLPPARPAARWGWGPGYRLYSPPAARPAAATPRNSPLPPPAAPPRPRRASAARQPV
eukprot:scaffold842_cov112-Isochrysis_galbana.AAC.1